MVLQFPLEKEPNYVTDCLVCDEELDDPKDNSVGHVVLEELEKSRPTEKLQSNHNAVIIPSSLPKVMNHVRKKDPST